MDDTWSIVFDTTTTMNYSALNELLYFKLGGCDTRDYGRNHDIMFDDMSDNELQVYTERLLNKLQSPIGGKHLNCFLPL